MLLHLMRPLTSRLCRDWAYAFRAMAAILLIFRILLLITGDSVAATVDGSSSNISKSGSASRATGDGVGTGIA